MEFLTGKSLADEIYDTIYYAEKYVIILSPFIQLDEYFKNEVFKTLRNNSHVHVILGFGKNETNITKSFKKQDIDFFMEFPNISIIYLPNLHGKIYANEKKVITTSMNLIDYSFINNIEFGVVAEKSLINSSLYTSALGQCYDILDNEGYTVYSKRPMYKKKFILGKDYVGSEVKLDLMDDLAHGKHINKIQFSNFIADNYVNPESIASRTERDNHTPKEVVVQKKVSHSHKNNGFCIRCHAAIELNIDKPLCGRCFPVWVRFEDISYPEKFCISCGNEKQTSFSKPACYSCYKKFN